MSSISIDEFFQRFAAAVSSVLSQALGSEWHATFGEDTSAPESVVARFNVGSPALGSLIIGMPRASASRLANLFVAGTDTAGDEWNPELQEAFEEFTRQIAGNFQTLLKPDLGDIGLGFDADQAPMRAAASRTFTAVNDVAKPLAFQLAVSAELADYLSAAQRKDSIAGSAERTPNGEANLELLMDVELAATLRFGQKRMVLRDILELSSGAVVELDRQVQDPVELLIDGKVVAIGDLVVVDGNYGIRVSQLASPTQRVGFISRGCR